MKKLMIALLLGTGMLMHVGCKDEAKGGDGKPGESGMAECDDYLKKLDACVAKMGPAGEGMKAAGDAIKQSVKAATTPESKEAVKKSCKQAAETLAATCK